jgi:integrase/recombinase XerD
VVPSALYVAEDGWLFVAFRAARTVSQVGGSLRDVQELAGHTSLAMTQRYIEGDTEAKRKLVALL